MMPARTIINRAALLLCGVLLQGVPPAALGDSVLAGYSFDDGSLRQWRLPNRLNEVSGLAVTADGRLLIADDGGNHKARLGIYRADRE